jgi:nucleoid DNA-binding protein
MTKQTFIERLSKKADITAEQSSIIVNAIEDHNLFAKDEKALIVADIAQQLEIDEDTAAKYFSHASQIISSEIKSQSIKWIAGTAVVIIAGIIVFRLRKK